MKNFFNVITQLNALQEKLTTLKQDMESLKATGESGAGMVKITLNGHYAMQEIKIDPSLLKAEEPQILEDLIIAAHNHAKDQLKTMIEEKSKNLKESLSLPGDFKLPL